MQNTDDQFQSKSQMYPISMINPTIIHLLIPFFLLIITHSSKTLITDHHKLVYTQCSNHTSPNPSHISLLPNLFQELITHSSKSSFYKTIVADEKTAISGSFQCRKDLSSDECRSCVIKSSDMSENLCGKILPARIQLRSCYIRYEEEEDGAEPQTDAGPEQILHRACSKRKIKRGEFEEMKYAAFVEVEKCAMSENGFCEMTYESIRVSAQCVGSLRSACDCGGCIGRAAEIACEDECRYSAVGEVYVDGCFISYDYIGQGGFGTYKGGGDRSPELVAIVVGGLAILAVGVGLCYFTKSCWKKKDEW